MKLKDTFVLRKIADQFVLIPRQEEADRLKSMILLSQTGGYICGLLTDEITRDDLVESLVEQYKIDHDTSENAVDSFMKTLIDIGCISE